MAHSNKVHFLKNSGGRVTSYSVGRQDIELDGSNWRSSQASYGQIRKGLLQAKGTGANNVTVQTLIRRDSQRRGFRWVSSSFNINEALRAVDRAQAANMPIGDFASSFHALNHPVTAAATWTFVPNSRG